METDQWSDPLEEAEDALREKLQETLLVQMDEPTVIHLQEEVYRLTIESAAKIRLALKKREIISKEAKKRSGFRSDLNSRELEDAPQSNLRKDLYTGFRRTIDFIGKECGVSGVTVDKFKYIEEHAPKIADDLCSGKKVNNKKLSIDGVYRDLRKEELSKGQGYRSDLSDQIRYLLAKDAGLGASVPHGTDPLSLVY
jgi:hypothetical protein